MNYRTAILSLALLCACYFFTGKENHAAVNVLLGFCALVSASVFVGSFFHHASEYSIAHVMFYVFSGFVFISVPGIEATIKQDVQISWEIISHIYVTSEFESRRLGPLGRAMSVYIIIVAGITVLCYFPDEHPQVNIPRGMAMFFLWLYMILYVASVIWDA